MAVDRDTIRNGFEQGDGRQFAVFAADFAAGRVNDGKIDTNDIAQRFSNQALEDMGLSPSAAMVFLVRDAVRNDPENASQAALKLAPSEAQDIEAERNNNSHEAQQQQQERWEENQRLQREQWEQKQWEQKQWAEEKRMSEERWEREQWEKEQAAQNRPAEDATNNQLLAMPFVAAGALAWMGLGTEAVEAAGKAMSPHAEALGDSTMMVSNNNGGLLADARTALGIAGPGQDAIVTGPNQAFAFTAGTAPEPEEPALTPGLQPGAPQAQIGTAPKMAPGMA